MGVGLCGTTGCGKSLHPWFYFASARYQLYSGVSRLGEPLAIGVHRSRRAVQARSEIEQRAVDRWHATKFSKGTRSAADLRIAEPLRQARSGFSVG